jgi:hypothetical protein
MHNSDRPASWPQSAKELVTVVGFLVTAVSLGLNAFSIWPNVPWSVVALLSFVAFCFLVWQRIAALTTELNDKIPNIDLCGEPSPHDVNMGNFRDLNGHKEFFLQSISHMANVPFSNKPEHPTSSNSVERVRAEITYLGADRKPVFPPIEGRWGGTYQPSEISSGQARIIESVDFPNTGAIRCLDLLMKYPEDEFCYGYNNASYNAPSLFLLPNYQIPTKRFFIQVRLFGAYIPKKVWEFEVTTQGKGDTFAIRHGATWQRTDNSKATKTPREAVQIF